MAPDRKTCDETASRFSAITGKKVMALKRENAGCRRNPVSVYGTLAALEDENNAE